MLYVDKPSARLAWRLKLLARFWARSRQRRRRAADLDLLALQPHLRRDLGLLDGPVRDERDVRLWM